MPKSRQLAAIMFTDIEGYTGIMQKNENNALMLKDRHRLILENEHKNFDGTIIQYYGDGSLSIFSSAVQAAQCALAMQQRFCQAPAVPVRIGLHMGDIMINDGSVFGDGVNFASRIESLGVVGSVLLSDKLNDEIHNHPELQTLSMGVYQLKNIEREVEVFALDHAGLIKPVPNSLKGKTREKKVTIPSPVAEKSVAVLPFVNMSNDPEQDYFGDGIAEEIVNSLSHLNDLKVAGRTSSFQFKGKNLDVRELGYKLGVNTVLEGSVRKSHNRLRITVQLINVEDGFHLWSERYDREIEDIFAIQDEIALCVTEKLKITLRETEKAIILPSTTPTESNEAYDYYLKGRFFWNRRGPALKKALEYFQKAADLDPKFSLAYVGLADTYALFGFYSVAPPKEVIPRARQAAERAIQLNPARIEPYSVLAYITTFYDWDWVEARKQFEKAIKINPSYAPTHYWYSNYLLWVKDYFHSTEEAFKAIELDPLISHTHNSLAMLYVCSGKYEEALRTAQTAVELDADSFISHCCLGAALYFVGRREEGIEATKFAVKISGRHQYALCMLSWMYNLENNISAVQEIFDELLMRSKTEFISGLSLAVPAYYSKNYDRAFEFVEKAFEEKASLLITMSGYPFFEFIKNDPRFQPFLQRMNYPE